MVGGTGSYQKVSWLLVDVVFLGFCVTTWGVPITTLWDSSEEVTAAPESRTTPKEPKRSWYQKCIRRIMHVGVF